MTPMGSGPVQQRPLPSLTEPDTAAFWRACGEHRLTYQEADDGQVLSFPRRHRGGQMRQSAGYGVIYSYTVIRKHGHPFYRERVPYVVAMIDMDEGFRLLAEVDADLEALHIGQRVQVGWEDHRIGDEPLSVPVFVLAE